MSIPEVKAIVYESEAVDALTVTSKSVEARAMISGLYNMFTEGSMELGYQKAWKALGYKGYQCGSVRYGARADGSVLFASGVDAMRITRYLVNEFDYLELRVTRIDLCVDIVLIEPKRGWLRDLRASANFQDLHSRQRRETTLIESDTGDTLYIGARTSGRYGRIYDKSLHYGGSLGSVYRFELETKKQVSPAVFKRLFPEPQSGDFSWDVFRSRVRGMIKGQFRLWGVHLRLGGVDAQVVRAEARISTVESQLDWLQRSVKPVFQKLEALGYGQLAFDAIGFPVDTFAGEVNESAK